MKFKSEERRREILDSLWDRILEIKQQRNTGLKPSLRDKAEDKIRSRTTYR